MNVPLLVKSPDTVSPVVAAFVGALIVPLLTIVATVRLFALSVRVLPGLVMVRAV